MLAVRVVAAISVQRPLEQLPIRQPHPHQQPLIHRQHTPNALNVGMSTSTAIEPRGWMQPIVNRMKHFFMSNSFATYGSSLNLQ